MKRQEFSMRFLALLLVMALMLSACAIQEPEVVVAPETVEEGVGGESVASDTGAPTVGVGDATNVLVTASSLTDLNFQNIDGQVSGNIQDLILDLSTGNILYATVEYGGFLDIGDTELPMPLSVFTWSPTGELVLAFDEATLQSFPDLGTDWPNLTTGAWDDEVNNFWRGAGIDPGFDFAEVSDSVVRASNILGYATGGVGYGVGDVGLGAGNINDMLVDLGQSQVAYVMIGGYDPAVYGNDLIAVPFNAFDTTAFGNELVFNQGVDATVLEGAPRFTRDQFLAGDAALYTDVNNYWGGLGFGPAAGVTATDDDAGTGVLEEQGASQNEGLGATTGLGGISGAENFLARGSTLLDYDIVNLAGEDIGEIEDMLIDVESGRILYATLEYGGFLDLGDREVPVPLSAFDWGAEDQLILNVAEERLEALPDVGADWPNVTDATWNDEVNTFWANEGIDPGFTAADSQTVMYLSNLIGYSLADVGFGAQGAIDDVMVNLSESYAPYALVEYGALFDNNLAAIPFSTFDVGLADGGFSFTPNIGLDVLQNAPLIDRASIEQTGLYDAGFDDEITTYWEDAGYEVGVGDGVLE